MEVHDVACHLGMERDWMAHALLQGEVLVVQVVGSLILVGILVGVSLGSHVVHASLTIKIPLINGVSHGLSDAPLPPSGTDIGRRVVGKVVGRDCGRRRRRSGRLRGRCAGGAICIMVLHHDVPSVWIIKWIATVKNFLRVVVVASFLRGEDVGPNCGCIRLRWSGFGDVDETCQALPYGSNGDVRLSQLSGLEEIIKIAMILRRDESSGEVEDQRNVACMHHAWSKVEPKSSARRPLW